MQEQIAKKNLTIFDAEILITIAHIGIRNIIVKIELFK